MTNNQSIAFGRDGAVTDRSFPWHLDTNLQRVVVRLRSLPARTAKPRSVKNAVVGSGTQVSPPSPRVSQGKNNTPSCPGLESLCLLGKGNPSPRTRKETPHRQMFIFALGSSKKQCDADHFGSCCCARCRWRVRFQFVGSIRYPFTVTTPGPATTPPPKNLIYDAVWPSR